MSGEYAGHGRQECLPHQAKIILTLTLSHEYVGKGTRGAYAEWHTRLTAE
jgi:hypothetical protein